MQNIRNLHVYGDENIHIPAHLNFGKYMFDRIRRMGDEVALVNATNGEQLSYKELTQYAVNLSVALRKLGIDKDDIVAYCFDSSIHFMAVSLAVIFTGATFTSHGLDSGKAILKHKLNIVPPTYLVCDEVFWNAYSEILENVKSVKKIITLDDAPSTAISIKSLIASDFDVHNFEPTEVNGQKDVAIIYYSSGTTGLPKGIQLTHLNCILHSLSHEYTSLQIAFVPGLWSVNYNDFKTYLFLAAGKKVVFVEKITDENTLQTNTLVCDILNAIQKYQVNIVFLVPAMIYMISNYNSLDQYNLSSLKIIFSRSSPLHAKTIEKITKTFSTEIKVLQGYGMTESGELASGIRGPKGPKSGSVGLPSPGIILKIVDPKTGNNLSPNTPGEICVKGPAFMKGYIDVDPTTYLDEERFFKTGDLGYYDEDGYFYIIDRLKEIIMYCGYNIAPLELETILHMHPDVMEAGVIGKPDPIYGELPAAFVVRQPGSNVTETELLNYIAEQVTPYMQLRGGVKFIEEIPKSSRGKMLRRRLREMLNEENITKPKI